MTRFFRAAIFMAFFLYAGNAFAAGGTCPSAGNYLSSSMDALKLPLVTLASLGVTNCYFIAASGSDSDTGTDEGHPWAHLPGMSTCAGNCAAHTPVAGEGYIFKGGDAWNRSNLGINFTWAGTVTNPIYIGVDQGWFTGASWSRPIWTCGGGACSGATANYFWNASGAYVILDNIELTGLFESSTLSPGFFCASGLNQTYENLYMHGWSHFAGITQTNARGFGFGGCVNSSGWTLRYTVWDGSDTSRDMLVITQGSAPTAYGNYFKYVQTALDGCGDNWHDNLFEFMAPSASQGGAHQDALYQYGPCVSPNPLIYNNVVRHTTWAGSGGAVKFWMSGNNGNTATGYAFNNLIYDNIGGNIIDTGGHFGVSYGTWYFFNNTVQCGTDSQMGACVLGDAGNKQGGNYTGGTMGLHLTNNHWITTGPILTCVQPTWTCTETTDLQQTLSHANAQGYTSTSAFAFQPTSASGSTITAAAKAVQSLCTTIGIIDASAGSACQSDTTYACTYDPTAHAVSCPARVAVARNPVPSIGAYQFGSIGASNPDPPRGLTVSVQ